MKQTQFIRNNAKLKGGKKPPKPKDYERAEDIHRAADLDPCGACGKWFDPPVCTKCSTYLNEIQLAAAKVTGKHD